MQSTLTTKANVIDFDEGEMVELSPGEIETVSGGYVLAGVGLAIVVYLYVRALQQAR